MSGIEYVVIRPQIVGNVERGFDTVYYSDLVRKPTRRAAIRHGWNTEGHDDWLLAHLRGDTLVMVSWQYEDRPEEVEERDEIATTFGWGTPPSRDTMRRTLAEQDERYPTGLSGGGAA